MANLKVKIARADGLPGFAAYLAGTLQSEGKTAIELEPNQALILLDVEAAFDDSVLECEDGSPVEPRSNADRKRELIESLMHEFGHVLEDYFGMEFSEEEMDRITASYARHSVE